MQFDSQAQKAFVIECFKKYPCTIEEALGYINAYSEAITAGTIIIGTKDDKDSRSDSGDRTPKNKAEKQSGPRRLAHS